MTQCWNYQIGTLNITIINMLKDITEKVNNIHEQMENFSIKLEPIGKIQMKMIEIKGNIKTNSDNLLISRLNIFGKRICEP